VDTSWYLDINRFARETSWAHGFMAAYAGSTLSPVGVGLIVFALLVVAGCFSARNQGERMPAALWAGLGAFAAFGLSLPVAQAIGRARPYETLAHVEVLLPRVHGHGLPDAHAALAGAALCGLLLAGRWRLSALALLAGLLLLFGRVYTGVDYPGDVAAGAGLGVAVVLVLWPVARLLLAPAVGRAVSSPLGGAVATKRARRTLKGKARHQYAPAHRLPDARVMEALRAASEAARAATHLDEGNLGAAAPAPPPDASPDAAPAPGTGTTAGEPAETG